MRVSVCSLGEETNVRFLEQVKLAEQLGFHAFMHADEKWTRDPYVRIAAATRMTSRIGLGFCVTDPYTFFRRVLAPRWPSSRPAACAW
jgi:alkanesulfonate monooxygenase SsuD/methylene tetrahydromethanopterin reductase-like flavin-dependent oxidoreductase (luciferase family)